MMKHLKRLVFFGVPLAVLAALFITAHIAQAAPLTHELVHSSAPSSGCAPGSSILSAVTAPSKRDAWAVGYCLNSNSTGNQTLTQHWNGSQWSIVTSPNAGSVPINPLQAVVARSCNDAWAVGYSSSNRNGDQTLIEHWNGSSWTIIPSSSSSPQRRAATGHTTQ